MLAQQVGFLTIIQKLGGINKSIVFLNNRFTNGKVKKENKKIFLSRKTSLWRKIVNEDIIFSQLKELNFENVNIENLTIDEQINLAFNSDVIISPLGAVVLLFVATKNKMHNSFTKYVKCHVFGRPLLWTNKFIT